MAVIIENMQTKVEWNEKLEKIISSTAEEALKEENMEVPVEVSVLIVDNEKIREMNQQYREIDTDTDVLSFPMLDYNAEDLKDKTAQYSEVDFDPDENELLLGDIVISLEKAEEQAKEYGHSFERELAFLMTHGMFHLLGYDHVVPEEQSEMRKKEESVLSKLKFTR